MEHKAVEAALAALDAVAAGATAEEVESRTLEFERQGWSRPDTVKISPSPLPASRTR